MAYRSRRTGKEVDELLDRVERGGGGASVTIDTELSLDSNNAIANSAVTNAIVSLGDVISQVGEDIDKKADTDGYYPTMSVGMADNLVGRGDVQDAHIGFRPTAGADNITDGAARIEKIKGNSVVWNQSVSNADFRNGTEGWGSSLADIYARDGYMEFVTNEKGSSQFNHYFAKSLTKGHKYIIMCDMERDTTDSYPFYAYFGKRAGGYDTFYGGDYSSDKRHIATAIITTTDEIPFMLIYPTINAPAGTTTKVYSVQVIDLTHMFGVGNEPTTYEEYLQRKPMNIDNEFAYNKGEIVDMRATSLISTSDNAYNPLTNKARVLGGKAYNITTSTGTEFNVEFFNDEISATTIDEVDGKYTFPNDGYCQVTDAYGDGLGDICVCLNHSYNKPHPAFQQDVKDLSFIGEAFIEGMRSVGKVCDEIRFNPTKKVWEKVTRIGVVDLGSLNWHKDSDFDGYYSDTPNPRPAVGFSGMCDRYPYKGSYRDVVEKTSGYIWEVCAYVMDSTFTDEEDCKQKLSGVRLLYELAEPIVEEIDLSPNTNIDYLVWDFGTEEAIADGQSAPFRADINYEPNAVDDLRWAVSEIRNLKAQLAQMQTSVTNLTE